ncbi:MAG: ECF transporter S component [Clostridia bacterium]|nr:ECF transporter S component [Clostridia bacterium]
MNSFKNRFSAKSITGIAVLLALVIVLQAVGGTISIGAVQLNFTLIPIVLGAILFGAWVGAFLGFACGVVVLIQVISGAVPLYVLMWTNDPVVTTLTCLVKTTVAGFLAGVLFNAISKKNETIATFVASAIVPIINTSLFVIGCLFMKSIGGEATGAGYNVLIYILVFIVTFNFFIELGINLVFAPALKRVIKIIERK